MPGGGGLCQKGVPLLGWRYQECERGAFFFRRYIKAYLIFQKRYLKGKGFGPGGGAFQHETFLSIPPSPANMLQNLARLPSRHSVSKHQGILLINMESVALRCACDAFSQEHTLITRQYCFLSGKFCHSCISIRVDAKGIVQHPSNIRQQQLQMHA